MKERPFVFARFYRLQRQKTQAQIAKAAGVSQPDLSEVENGTCTRASVLKKLARVFHADPAILMVEVPASLDPAKQVQALQAKMPPEPMTVAQLIASKSQP